jgi:hypothetical protein
LTYYRFKSHSLFKEKAFDLEIHQELQRILFYVVVLRIITKKLTPEIVDFIDERYRTWGVDDLVDEFTDAEQSWVNVSQDEIWDKIENSLVGIPFSDLGEKREVIWSALGVEWKVGWENNYVTTLSVQQFIAVFQILLADLAGGDLCLLRTMVNIEFHTSNIVKPEIVSLPSNKGRKWHIKMPIRKGITNSTMQDLQTNVLTVAYTILDEISLLPFSSFKATMESCFRDGLPMKVFVAKPYEVLHSDFITENDFTDAKGLNSDSPVPPRPLTFMEHENLKWIDSPGPGYSEKTAEKYLQNRYEILIPSTQITVKRLMQWPEFNDLLEQLRLDGWRDWHILASIHSIATNYRAGLRQRVVSSGSDITTYQGIFHEIAFEPENNGMAEVPLTLFSENRMRDMQRINMMSTLKNLGLECRQHTPDLDAIDYFLRVRYNYWADDIEHEDPFV